MCSKIGSCPVCKLTLLAIKHKDMYGTHQKRKEIAEGQLQMIDTMLKKRERANKSHLTSHAKVSLEIGTTQMWNTKQSPKEAPVAHFHNRDMYLAYAEMLRMEKNEKLMRSSNVFMQNWGALEANVPSRSPLQRYELPPLKQKKAQRNQLYKSVDLKGRTGKRRLSPKQSAKKLKSIDAELERAQERIKMIQMISMLREEKLKAEYKTRERNMRRGEW